MFWKWRNRDRRNQKYSLINWKRRKTSAFTYGITPVMRRNTRLKRSKAGWFPRVPRSLLDARYRGYERAERYREKAEAFWTTVKSDEEFIWNDIGSTLVARQRTYSRGELHCLRKKGEPCCATPSFCFLLFVYLSSPPPFFLFFFALHGTLAKESRVAPLAIIIFRIARKNKRD